MNPYPDENAWWPIFEQEVANRYAAAQHPFPDPAAFRWHARTAYDIAAGLTKEASAAKHLRELDAALGLTPPPPPVNLLPIRIDGARYFRTDAGPIFLKGATAFHWFESYVKGVDLSAVIADQHGFDEARVLLTYQGTLGTFDGRQHADQLRPFCEWLASTGRRVELTCWADTLRIEPDPAKQLAWVRQVDALVGDLPYVSIEGVNEDGVHDNTAPGLQVPTPIQNALASHGAARTTSTNWSTAQPVWRVACVHTDRDSEWMRKVGHNAAEAGWRFGTAARNNEIKRPDQYGYRANEAFEAAAGAMLFLSGATFHCASMRDNQIMTDGERACAQAWLAGLAAVPIEYRAGDYANAPSSRAPIVHKDEWAISTHSRILGNRAVSVVCQRNSQWKAVPKGDWRPVSQNGPLVFSERT